MLVKVLALQSSYRSLKIFGWNVLNRLKGLIFDFCLVKLPWSKVKKKNYLLLPCRISSFNERNSLKFQSVFTSYPYQIEKLLTKFK